MQRALLAAILAVACAAGRAHAQSPVKRLSLGVGVGNTIGVATDDSNPKRIYAGSIRFDVKPHVAIEGEVAQWGREQTFQSGPGRFTDVVNNLVTTLGEYQSHTTRYSDSTWATSVNVLAHTNTRVSIFGGGGLGVGVTNREYTTSYVGCSHATRPQTCSGSSSPRHGSGATIQAVGGFDARVTQHAGGFVTFIARSGYLYGPHQLSALAGVRIGLR